MEQVIRLQIFLYASYDMMTVSRNHYGILPLCSEVSSRRIEIPAIARTFYKLRTRDRCNWFQSNNHVLLKIHTLGLRACSIIDVWSLMHSGSHTMSCEMFDDAKSCLRHSLLDLSPKGNKLTSRT